VAKDGQLNLNPNSQEGKIMAIELENKLNEDFHMENEKTRHAALVELQAIVEQLSLPDEG
jgi:hypothetical protein